MRLRVALVIAIVAAAFAIHTRDAVSLLAQMQTSVGDYPPTPGTIEGLWERSPVVVRARVGNDRPRMIRTSIGELVFRIYDIEVVTTFKDDGSLGGRNHVDLAQAGGSMKLKGQGFMTPDDMRRLRRGTQEFLFLMPWPSRRCYVIAFGSGGAFQLADDAVSIPDGDRRMPTFSGRSSVPLDQFISVLNALRDKGRSLH